VPSIIDYTVTPDRKEAGIDKHIANVSAVFDGFEVRPCIFVTTIADYFTLFDVPVPMRFHSDNGGELINWTMTPVCEKLGVKSSTSLPRNPQCQGLVEERNKTLKRKVEQKAMERGWKLSRSKKHTMEWMSIVHEIIRNENDAEQTSCAEH
jgi:transposase InsO family protein